MKEFVFHVSGALAIKASNHDEAWDLFLNTIEEKDMWFEGVCEVIAENE